MAEAQPPRTITSFFGAPADRTRGANKRPRAVKKQKDVVAKQSKATLEAGMAEPEFSVRNQKITCVPGVKDARSRERKIGTLGLKPSTKKLWNCNCGVRNFVEFVQPFRGPSLDLRTDCVNKKNQNPEI